MQLMRNPFKLLGLIAFIQRLHFLFPVLILIYRDKGVSIGDYFLIQGIYLWATVFMEVPSGYFADLFSRRLNLAFAGFLYALATAIWFFGYGFWVMLIGELLFGFGDAFLSGTSDAYIYELSKQYKKKKQFHNILSKQVAIGNVGFFFSACSGALIFWLFGANGTIGATLIAYGTAFLLYLLLPETKEEKRHAKNQNPLFDIIGICTRCWRNREIRIIILAYAIFASCMSVFHWGLQPLMVTQEIPVYMYSLATGAAILAWSVWAGVGGKVLEKIGISGIFWTSWGLYAMSFALVAIVCLTSSEVLAQLLLPVIAFLSGNRELSRVGSSTLINHRVPSDERATSLSFQGLVQSLFMGATLVAFKPLSEAVEVENAFFWSALLLIPTLFFVLQIARMNISIQKQE